MATGAAAVKGMISFDTGGHRFNLRAAAVVRDAGRILLHRLESDDFWSAPGGRVEPGEPAAEAVVREMREELGEPVSCGGLLGVVENFFCYHGRPHHEVGLYFQVSLRPGSRLLSEPGPFIGEEGGVPLIFDWFDCARLGELDVRPSLLAGLLDDRSPAGGFRHVVHHDPDPA